VIEAWDSLPTALRAAILAMIDAADTTAAEWAPGSPWSPAASHSLAGWLRRSPGPSSPWSRGITLAWEPAERMIPSPAPGRLQAVGGSLS